MLARTADASDAAGVGLHLGEQHLRKVLAEYAQHYNSDRLHQESPLHQRCRVVDVTARIERKSVVGGLISEYRRTA